MLPTHVRLVGGDVPALDGCEKRNGPPWVLVGQPDISPARNQAIAKWDEPARGGQPKRPGSPGCLQRDGVDVELTQATRKIPHKQNIGEISELILMKEGSSVMVSDLPDIEMYTKLTEMMEEEQDLINKNEE